CQSSTARCPWSVALGPSEVVTFRCNGERSSACRYSALPVVTSSSAAAQYCSSRTSLSPYGPPPGGTLSGASMRGCASAAFHARSAATRQRLLNAASNGAYTRLACAATAARLSVAAVLGACRKRGTLSSCGAVPSSVQ